MCTAGSRRASRGRERPWRPNTPWGGPRCEGRPLTRSIRALYLSTERLGAATVAVSSTVAGRLRDWGVPADRIRLVPNGIDADRFRFDGERRASVRAALGIPEDGFVVGGVGRLVPGKRFDVLIRAVAALPEARLLLAGDGPEAGALRALALRLGAVDRIRFLGECDEDGEGPVPGVPALLSALDVFVSTSREESFGLAAVEALAAGLPVLHDACPAIDDLPAAHAPGATRIAGSPEELADRLRQRIQARPDRRPPPRAVGHYDIRRSSERLMDVYAYALDTAPPNRRAHS
ncbi:glycosyl transferase [Streptomyces badius]